MEELILNNEEYQIEELSVKNVNGEQQLSVSSIVKRAIKKLKSMNYKEILDLGCGTGRISLFLANKKFEVFATDVSVKSLNLLRGKIEKENIDNIEVKNDDFKNLGFADCSLDAVISRSTLHHAKLKEIKKGINETLRVLKPNGCFVFDMISEDDYSHGKGKKIEDNTFVGSRKGEEGITHYYTNLQELKCLLKDFSRAFIYKTEYRIKGMKSQIYRTKVFDVIAYK